MTLPVTPSIRRLAVAFLGFDPWHATVAATESPWFSGWVLALPLTVPAGLAIAARRMDELGGDGEDVDPVEARAYLLTNDPELKGASDIQGAT